ncbi:MAG: lytic murein transglycosylase B [Gammaproteobacteria bacterium]|nr:lytic murein transglycosylase B [Gammaproteobacteria bacterium]
MRFALICIALLIGNDWAGNASAGNASDGYAERPEVQAYISELVETYQFEEAALLEVFRSARRQNGILEAIARPAERTKSWAEYREIFVNKRRIDAGTRFWGENEAALKRAEQRYNVAPEVIVAIIGVETRYGRVTGGYRVVDALATLAFDYPPRAAFFRSELTHLLLLARDDKLDPLALTGSYAGAMGYGQFMPSSYREYAIDFDGDGVRDIWTNTTDAIGSVANYFSRHGWRGDGPVAVRVEVHGDAAKAVANQGLKLAHGVGALRALGVEAGPISDDAMAALFEMEGDSGVEYWLGLHDFYVITRYNHSQMYALAVWQLGEAIRLVRADQNLADSQNFVTPGG